jgi:hypothetical protein
MDLGTIPQWLTFAAAVVGFRFTARQLKHNQSVRETESVLSILNSTIAHNTSQAPALAAIQKLENLNVPNSESEAKRYWAMRDLHLSHINLIWHVWELAERPGPGERINERYDGWERFACKIIKNNLLASVEAVQSGGTAPEDLAASDLWFGMRTYEVFPTRFADWLVGLDDRATHRRSIK